MWNDVTKYIGIYKCCSCVTFLFISFVHFIEIHFLSYSVWSVLRHFHVCKTFRRKRTGKYFPADPSIKMIGLTEKFLFQTKLVIFGIFIHVFYFSEKNELFVYIEKTCLTRKDGSKDIKTLYSEVRYIWFCHTALKSNYHNSSSDIVR